MIIAVNRANNAFIVFDTDIQDDVENTLVWMAGDLGIENLDYYLTKNIEGWDQQPRIRPNKPHDEFLLTLLPYVGEIEYDEKIDWLITDYNYFWKNRSPFKEFFGI